MPDCLPEPISGWGWNVNSESSIQFLQLDCQYQPRVRNLSHRLLDILVLGGTLEIFRGCNLVDVLHPGFPLSTAVGGSRKK